MTEENFSFHYEFMRPQQIIEAREKLSVIFLPIGPLEWHGPAMPYGTDPLIAQAISEGAIRKLCGGICLPALYWGTEKARSSEVLQNLGFNGDEYIIGQDFPKNNLPSFYVREEIFAITISEYLRLIEKQGFSLAVIINVHGADGQKSSLNRLLKQFNGESKTMKVIMPRVIKPLNDQDIMSVGHATILETSLMMYLTNSVDLSQLPPRNIPLRNQDWGIDDGATYEGKGNPEGTVIADPRDATAERGKQYFDQAVEITVSEVKAILNIK